MKIEIIKDHESGLTKGQMKNIPDHLGKRLIVEGLAKEVKAEKAPKKDKAEKPAIKNKSKK
jgi:hypothetical protein